MPAILIPVLLWILANPQQAAGDAIAIEQAAVKAVEAAIVAWRRWQAGLLTDAQLQAEWKAQGIDVDAANAEWVAAGK